MLHQVARIHNRQRRLLAQTIYSFKLIILAPDMLGIARISDLNISLAADGDKARHVSIEIGDAGNVSGATYLQTKFYVQPC